MESKWHSFMDKATQSHRWKITAQSSLFRKKLVCNPLCWFVFIYLYDKAVRPKLIYCGSFSELLQPHKIAWKWYPLIPITPSTTTTLSHITCDPPCPLYSAIWDPLGEGLRFIRVIDHNPVLTNNQSLFIYLFFFPIPDVHLLGERATPRSSGQS